MKPLDEAVGLWMVGRGHVALDAPSCRELGPGCRRELRSSIGGYGGRDAKGGDPTMSESVCNSFRGDVGDWYGYWPT